jgi:aminoglycoside phosphotransferase (APT) family kinase protein
VRKSDVDLVLLQDLIQRVLPSGTPWRVERTPTGTSTQVYRLQRAQEVLYLRVAEEEAAHFAPEVYAHTLLRARGVQVPAIVYYDPFYAPLERSLMITTEIRGTPLGQHPPDATTAAVVRAAGRDLALINQAPVAGFGWIRRDAAQVTSLRAMHVCYRDFILEHLEEDLAVLGRQALPQEEVAVIRAILAHHAGWLDSAHAWLAHGDLDVSHIYQQDGSYSGIIDFGEIRGADPFYDLGHFHLHDGETVPMLLLPALLEGYREVRPLPSDHMERIHLVSLVLGVRALAGSLQRPASAYQAFVRGALRRVLADLHT